MRGRWYWTPPLLVVAAALATLLLDRETGLLALRDLRGRCAQAEQRIGELDTEREGLISEIEALRRSPFAIESFARERLGMLRPGELVIRLPGPRDGAD